MTLRIGDRVVIASNGKPAVLIPNDSCRGNLIDMKWNLGLVRFNDDETEWLELKRIYKAAE